MAAWYRESARDRELVRRRWWRRKQKPPLNHAIAKRRRRLQLRWP